MNKLRTEDYPQLFEAINEDYDPVDTDQQHRRGSSFYNTDIIEINEDWKEYVPSLTEEYYGYWKTNTYCWDDDWGRDMPIDELTRVEKKEVITTTTEWVPVND